ncbi:hypothetical protein ATI61_1272 [Archangium gephyra]|uniref:SMI1/KNR4 family protein n=1 Tax=Archangium gephyra TaxID=48 RepID=A0ABX9JKC6_9BACT|nr:hypothetical protein [Archangium gephyra]REG14283.1 hypothetical protein ATI61_1272 [Archangium gephyra]
MNELLALLERYAPGYAERIQGASAWNLFMLKKVFGQSLPEFYQEFVEVMGKDGGPLLAHVDSYDPYDVTELYEVAWRELPPRRFLFVFGDPSPDDQHYWLDLEAPSEDGDCKVFRFPFGTEEWKKHGSPLYMSLREMLFVWAMSNVGLPTFPHRAAYYSRLANVPPNELLDAEDVARIFERLRFVRLPYPQRCMLFERDDAAIELYRSPDEPGFSFRVGMRNAEEFRRFQGIMEDIKGLAKE